MRYTLHSTLFFLLFWYRVETYSKLHLDFHLDSYREKAMRKSSLIFFVIATTTFCGATFGAGDDTHVGRAITYSGQASAAALGSAAHSIAASGQVTSAMSAIPLSIGGAVLGSAGAVSAGAAKGSMKAATAPIGTPLKVSDEAITVTPPNEALKSKDNQKSN